MIKTKLFKIGNRDMQKTYSEAFKIRQIETGIIYDEAIDVLPCRYTYEETDMPIEEEITAEEALEIITGGDQQ